MTDPPSFLLRVLYASVGVQHCPSCGRRVGKQTAQQILESILALPAGARVLVLAPLVQNRKGEYRDLLADVQKRGFARVRVDGMIHQLAERLVLDKKLKHDIELVVDRLVVRPDARARIQDSVEAALHVGKGRLVVTWLDGGEQVYSDRRICNRCNVGFPELEPDIFSFNSPLGMFGPWPRGPAACAASACRAPARSGCP